MKNLEKVLNDNLHILYGDLDIKKVFPEGTVSFTYKRRKCLKELISPSLYPKTVTESASRVSKCSEGKCDIWKNYMVFKNKFTCTVTGKRYNIWGGLTCKSDNVIYLISDINTDKGRCGVAKHFLNICIGINKLENLKVQLIEEVKEGNYDIEGKL